MNLVSYFVIEKLGLFVLLVISLLLVIFLKVVVFL